MEEILERIKKARFITTDEVYANREEIRKVVQLYDLDTLEVYKWYFFFQLCLLKNPLKSMLWDYLVKEHITLDDELNLAKEYRNYKERCQKILKYQSKNKEESEEVAVVEQKRTVRITCVEDLFRIWLNKSFIVYCNHRRNTILLLCKNKKARK